MNFLVIKFLSDQKLHVQSEAPKWIPYSIAVFDLVAVSVHVQKVIS